MAQMANTQTVALQLEKVRKKLPLMYERDNVLFAKIEKRGEKVENATRAMRLPLQLRPGGKAGQATMDGDDLGRGSGTKYDVPTVTPIFFRFAVEITKLVEYATNSSEKAIENAAKKEVKNGMAQFRSFLDKLTQTAGNGVLGTIGAINALVLTLSAPYKAQLCYFNQTVSVYSANLATKRGTAEITAIDYDAGTITVDAVPGGTIVTDLIVVDGVSGASPVSLFGLKYHHSVASTGTWLTLDRANYPEVRTPRVNAANSALAPAFIRLAKNKIRKALGVESLENVVAYLNLDQQHAWEAFGLSISTIIKQGADQKVDPLFNKDQTMDGTPQLVSINADPTRIDFIALDHWGRAEIQGIDYYQLPNGQTIFPVYGASGGLASAYLFYFVTGFQIWNDNPRKGSYIDALLQPSGY